AIAEEKIAPYDPPIQPCQLIPCSILNPCDSMTTKGSMKIPAIKNDQNVTVSGLYSSTISLSNIVYITMPRVDTTKRIFPQIDMSTPLSKMGLRITMITPIKLISVPMSTFRLGISFRKKNDPMIRKIGADEPMIG